MLEHITNRPAQTDYAVAPGEYLEEWMHQRRSGPQEVANLLGTTQEQVIAILNAKVSLDEETAVELARVTGIPTRAWLRYQENYLSDLARINQTEALR